MATSPCQRIQDHHEKSKKFDKKNEDFLKANEEQHLLEQLELLQVSGSNKLIKVRFDKEQTAPHFVGFEVHSKGNCFTFSSNAQRQLRVPFHGMHPNVTGAALRYELMQYFGGVLEIKQDTKQNCTKQEHESL